MLQIQPRKRQASKTLIGVPKAIPFCGHCQIVDKAEDAMEVGRLKRCTGRRLRRGSDADGSWEKWSLEYNREVVVVGSQSPLDDRVTYHRSIQFFLLSPSWKNLHTAGTYLNVKLTKEILAP